MQSLETLREEYKQVAENRAAQPAMAAIVTAATIAALAIMPESVGKVFQYADAGMAALACGIAAIRMNLAGKEMASLQEQIDGYDQAAYDDHVLALDQERLLLQAAPV